MKRILIAEDDPASRLLLTDALDAAGYDIVTATNGSEALQVLEETGPDLVLMDIQMPVLDGFGALRQIRSSPALAHLPVFALTAFAMTRDAEKCLAAGFDEYVTKPVDLALLRGKIEKVFAGGSI